MAGVWRVEVGEIKDVGLVNDVDEAGLIDELRVVEEVLDEFVKAKLLEVVKRLVLPVELVG